MEKQATAAMEQKNATAELPGVAARISRVTAGHYTYVVANIELPEEDSDVTICLPNGQHLTVQWRIENETIDVCTSEPKVAYVQEEDMVVVKPRKKDGAQEGVVQITLMD